MCTKKLMMNCFVVFAVFFVLLMGCSVASEQTGNDGVSGGEFEQISQTSTVSEREDRLVYRVPFEGELPAVTPLPSVDHWPLETSESVFLEPGDNFQPVVVNGRVWVYNNDRSRSLISPEAPPLPAWVSSDGYKWIKIDDPIPRPERDSYSLASFGGGMLLLGGAYLESLYRGLSDVWFSGDGFEWNLVSNQINTGPISSARLSVWQNTLYLLGGFDQEKRIWHEGIWASLDGENWILETSSVEDNFSGYYDLVATDNYLVVFLLTNGLIRSADGQNWEHISAFTEEGESQGNPPNRWDFQAVWFHDQLVVLGGMHHPDIFEYPIPATDVWASVDGAQWEQIAPRGTLPERYDPIVIVFKDRIFFIGGYIESESGEEPLEWKREVWVSDDAVTWNLLAEDPTQREVTTR